MMRRTAAGIRPATHAGAEEHPPAGAVDGNGGYAGKTGERGAVICDGLWQGTKPCCLR